MEEVAGFEGGEVGGGEALEEGEWVEVFVGGEGERGEVGGQVGG